MANHARLESSSRSTRTTWNVPQCKLLFRRSSGVSSAVKSCEQFGHRNLPHKLHTLVNQNLSHHNIHASRQQRTDTTRGLPSHSLNGLLAVTAAQLVDSNFCDIIELFFIDIIKLENYGALLLFCIVHRGLAVGFRFRLLFILDTLFAVTVAAFLAMGAKAFDQLSGSSNAGKRLR